MTAVDHTPAPGESAGDAPRFRLLPPDRPSSELEEELLARWREELLFARTQEGAEGKPAWVFFEGPPTANGRPGIHHVFARTLKDLICRHRAMRGFHVTRKAGWDTHGLPVEIEVEKALGISGKQQIEALGVEEFNQACRESVWKYRGDWERLSERIAYWLDYSDPYVTYENDYVESVWWALATLHGKGLLYRGYKILPYCARCGTALSSMEVAQGYQEVESPSTYVALDLAVDEGAPRRRILVWTTTPWTLPSNVALAVKPDLPYAELRKKTGAEWTIVLAEARVPGVLGLDWADRWEVVRRFEGRELVGQRYRRPLDWVDYALDGANAGATHEVIVGEDFVSAEDGTGVVHMAPAFGADDYAAGRRHNLAFVQPVNGQGRFDDGVPVVGGLWVKDADPLIVAELKKRDVLWKAGTMTHSYPHCWRCRTPLLYYARSSWFVRTTAFKDEMIARNARVDWHPEEIGSGRFGEWLTNNIDWAISRDRYWGTPLPIWVCENDDAHLEAIGSYAKLAERTGTPLGDDFDPHKPYIDRHTMPCTQCGGTMRRVPQVVDTWFDSGSMPFAQWHYPFENVERLAAHYPADYIAEGQDQTRGWFYSLLAIATGLGDALPNNAPPTAGPDLERSSAGAATPPGAGLPDPGPALARPDTAPYRSVIVNSLVLDAHGKKMSKSVGNVVDPWAVIAAHGADAVRLFLVEASQVWLPRSFDENAIRERAGRFLLTLKNTYTGIFAQYANFGWSPGPDDPAPHERPALDRWVLSRLRTVEVDVDRLLERFEPTLAARAVVNFLTDDVSNWYVRLSRGRFWVEDVRAPDARAAFATLHEVLAVTCRLLAPFMPFVSDWIHRELTGVSVHLAPYVRSEPPAVTALGAPAAPAQRAVDLDLVRAMTHVRTLATLGRAAREEAGIKVRQPLGRMVCVVPESPSDVLTGLTPLLAGELNVKRVEFATSGDALVTLEAKANFRSLGKKFGKQTPQAAQAVAALGSDALRRFEAGEPLRVTVGAETRALDAEDVTIVRRASGALLVSEEAGYFAALDPAVTPELRREGIARELVSRVQRLRKDAGLFVSDRVRLWVGGGAEVEEAVREHRDWIAGEVLAAGLHVGEDQRGMLSDDHAVHDVDLDGLAARVALTKDR